MQLTVPGVYWEFTVARAESPEGPFDHQGFEYIGCTKGCEWFDRDLEPGETYWFSFDLLARDGTRMKAGPTPVTIPKVSEGALSCLCSPNPFAGEMTLSFRIPAKLASDGEVGTRVRIHDLSGRTVRTLFEGDLGRGVESVTWDGRDTAGRELRSGVYFYAVQAGSARETGRLLKLR